MYGNNSSGFGNNNSRSTKNNTEVEMTSIALKEAIHWTDRLMAREFKGRGDKEYLIRHRLSENSGVPESYLYRLQYKSREMKDVAGEYYRRLRLYYERVCDANEEAADRYMAERLELKRTRDETADEEPVAAGDRMGAVDDGAAHGRQAKEGR